MNGSENKEMKQRQWFSTLRNTNQSINEEWCKFKSSSFRCGMSCPRGNREVCKVRSKREGPLLFSGSSGQTIELSEDTST